MKVIYMLSSLKKSGPVNQLYDLIKNIDEDIDVFILVLNDPLDSRISEFKELNITICNLNLSRFFSIFTAKKKIMKYISDIQPDIVHSQGIRADLVLSKIPIAAKKISTIHNFPQLDYKHTYGLFLGFLMKLIHLNAWSKFNQCICVSDSVLKNIHALRHNIQLTSILNGVDREIFFEVGNNMKRELRVRLKLPIESTLWLYSGHLNSRKDPMFLIDLFMKLPSKHVLILMGTGEMYSSLYKLAGNVTNIIFLGQVANVVNYIQASDFIVSASVAEGLPLSVIEGLACGLPALLSNIPPHAELLKKFEIGKLFSLKDKNDFLNSMNELIKEDYLVMQNNCNKLISGFLNDKVMAENYLRIYNGI